jgi:hypothetical protein
MLNEDVFKSMIKLQKHTLNQHSRESNKKSFLPPIPALDTMVSTYLDLCKDMVITGPAMTLKQQRSQTLNNYIDFMDQFYEGLDYKPNLLEPYYPADVRKRMSIRRNITSKRVVKNLKAPAKHSSELLKKMRQLTQFQSEVIQVTLNKIDRKSKPIKKQDKLISTSLKNKNMNIECDNFDIENLLLAHQRLNTSKQRVKKQKMMQE